MCIVSICCWVSSSRRFECHRVLVFYAKMKAKVSSETSRITPKRSVTIQDTWVLINATVRTSNVANTKLVEGENLVDQRSMGGSVGDVTYSVVYCVVVCCWCCSEWTQCTSQRRCIAASLFWLFKIWKDSAVGVGAGGGGGAAAATATNSDKDAIFKRFWATN